MRLLDLFHEMEKRSLTLREKIEMEYFHVKDRLEGKVPNRLELFTYMDDPVYQLCMKHPKENPFRRYLSYLYERNELSDREEELYHTIGREFLALIEVTDMQKVYKMPVLAAFYNNGNIRMNVTEHDILESWKQFFSNGTNWRDLRKNITYDEYIKISDSQHLSNAKKNPVRFLKASGKGFFVEREGFVLGLRDEMAGIIGHQAFRDQMKDIIAYRTMEYYRRRYTESFIDTGTVITGK